ncbi:phage tail protein [Paenibacillus nicotianae]|uniref:Phage tail protein n=1 Tax=Paenibacillus nicotianae TaxID=1526551 RepID=A0ABW4UVW0_9BACL
MEPFLGELRIFPYGFIPKGWLACNGQILSINQNAALASLLGQTYGGDGKTTFGLPNLQGQVPLGTGMAASTKTYTLGQKAGEANHSLTINEMPQHNHNVNASSATASSKTPTNNAWSAPAPNTYKPSAGATPVTLPPNALSDAGTGTGHNNMQPFLALTICIATTGLYPPRP